MRTKLLEARRALNAHANAKKAEELKRFFKTEEGEYGAGDRFMGISVPQVRAIAKEYADLPDAALSDLMKSPLHEERLMALEIWCMQMEGAVKIKDKARVTAIAKAYLTAYEGINNWDLVDLSTPTILGPYIESKGKADTPMSGPKHVIKAEKKGFTPPADEEWVEDEPEREITDPATLKTGSWMPKNLWAGYGQMRAWAKGGTLWQKRIAMLSTFYFIKKNELAPAIDIATILVKEEHDLLQKAVGWMLRELGKQNLELEEAFLKVYYNQMGRTALRYAIEKFPEGRRQMYLKGRV